MSAGARLVFLAVNASYSHVSLAAWRLRQAARPLPWAWETVEATVNEDPSHVVDRVVRARPAVIAATLYLFNHDFVRSVLRRCRELLPGVVMLVGGPECLGDNRPIAGPGGFADWAVRGEGERVFPAWLAAFHDRERWRSLPGLCGMTADGCWVDNGTAELPEDLETAAPDYARELEGFRKPFVQVETARGCGNGCRFCASRGTPVRHRDPARVRAELEAIAAAGVRDVRVLDRTFNDHPGRAIPLLRLFRDEFPGLRFHLEVDPGRVDDALLAELAVAGPRRFHLETGLQTLESAARASMGRVGGGERALEGLRRLCAIPAVETHVDLIAGLPGATLAGVRADIGTLMRIAPAEIQLERLKLLPGTPFADASGAWGLVGAPQPPYAVLSTPTMSADELGRVDAWSKLLDGFYNVPVLRPVVAAACRADPGVFEELERCVREGPGFTTRPGLEERFRLLDAVLTARGSAEANGLRYLWFRQGYSARHGLAPARPWNCPIPAGAELVEGSARARVSRAWVVALDRTYCFCYGTAPRGGRGVVAVWILH
jgi:radical SAM superfamily enzyme YgiQ (UPF0313 family)